MYTLTLFAILNYGMGEAQLDTFVDANQYNGFLECIEEGDRRVRSFITTRETSNNAIYIRCEKIEE